MSLNPISSKVSGFFRFIGALFVPKTPRGKLRRAIFFVLVLFVVAGNLSHPAFWDAKTDWVNGQLSKVPVLSKVQLPHFWNVPYRLGLDLQGGTHLVYRADMKDVPESEQADAIAGSRDVIERRVNAFGVSEPLVQTNKSGDEWRLVVDLAGVSDVAQAIKQIGETPILEFKETGDMAPQRELTAEEKKDMDAFNKAAAAKVKNVQVEALKPEADFAALAKEYSEIEATKELGGDIGFVNEQNGQYGPIAQLLKSQNIQPGSVMKDTLSLNGYTHLVKLEERRDAGEEIRASHILYCYSGAPGCEQTRTKEEAKKLAEDLKAKLTPQNFAEEAKTQSDDKGSGSLGGDLDWFGRGRMVPQFETAAFALQKDQISEAVESDFGFHIIIKTDSRPTYEYRVRDIGIKTKTAADYLPPPDPWKNTALSGKHLKRSSLQFNPQTSEAQVGIDFNDDGKKLFADITERNVGKPIAIFLDGQILSAPTVNEAIRDGSAVITGRFTVPEAKQLAMRLNAGALPVAISLESQQTVGASLGKSSLDASLKAGLIGFMVVALFMLLYYRLPGLIAILALGLYTAINLSLYKLIPVTMTLSGIAGFILSVGMAVDANILIFERMKEELKRGRPLGSALDEGFKRAWTSIRDSNFTTLISCAILFFTSSSLIKGFALTLGLGVLVSMFSAITVSRSLLRLVTGWSWAKPQWLYLPGLTRAKVETEQPSSGGSPAGRK